MLNKPKRNRLFFSIVITVCLLFSLIPNLLYAQSAPFDAMVKDIADSEYREMVINLLIGATESIAISMYNLSIGGHEDDPIKWLFEDLLTARKRGVGVTLYINSNLEHVDTHKPRPNESLEIKKLKEVGCIIYLMPEDTRLLDKLIVVDNRYVIESTTLIDSPTLAEAKMRRFKNFPILEEAKN